MSGVELYTHLCTIFFDLVLPALVAYIAWQIRKWLPAEVGAHKGLHELTAAVKEFTAAPTTQQATQPPKK